MSGKPPIPKIMFPRHVEEKMKAAEDLNKRAFLTETDPGKKNEMFIQSKLMKMNALRDIKDYQKRIPSQGIAHPGTMRRKVQLKGGRKRSRKQLKRK